MQQVMREVSKFLLRRVAPDRTVLVGVDGGVGSGKTTFTRHLVEILGETGTTVSTAHLDLFCRPRCERATPDCSLAVVADADGRTTPQGSLREDLLSDGAEGPELRSGFALTALRTLDPPGALQSSSRISTQEL